jgi:hypothetical protein
MHQKDEESSSVEKKCKISKNCKTNRNYYMKNDQSGSSSACPKIISLL